ncbi:MULTISPECIES: lycopene cyclase family protein [Cellulophaga]|uniref:lycopene cyclase family protein n=1 Tax=Cellulophaga TaxID=104264 RepID=UPI000426299C|nr:MULTISPECIES: lycopene cyclase family protein [Cellulophaga]AIY12847.1 lycopene cyclase [Cellulophaga baltica NN016038]KGK32157.1 lycopene cyclase [Cellulophaga sp. E6(2014)]
MNSFDYIIIGAGAAGLSLANAMGKDSFFSKKSILLLDKNAKQTNDRTWCFWEKGEGDFDDILHKKWSSIQFAGQQIDQRYPIAPYEYKMIQGLDFYASMFKKLDEYPNITFLNEEVISVTNTATVNTVKTANNTFIAATLFNSIFDYKEALQQQKYPVLQQHFIGWFIKTEQPVFDPKVATFMDFSIPQRGNTRFMYLLPTTAHEALIEYTLFSEHLLKASEYEEAIKKYISQKIGVNNYEIVEKEQGSIPMTSYNFTSKNTSKQIFIGTAGGWTKASTGYTFKSTQKKVTLLIQHLKDQKPLQNFGKRDKFWFYDLLLLDILHRRNDLGQSIFEALFKNRKPQLIFKFLDEETSLLEDVKFISALSPMPFIKALLRRIF